MAHVRGEVLLVAGSVNAPKILDLSGIGDPAVLKKLDIPVLQALKGYWRKSARSFANTHGV
ncbi:MAG: GMC family oxidoreductase N-terminal domain-containing protein [Magnetovibrio sp.]|nr:GMC family oxidoreductase N-terminal domain-containing protein [Magnetovibrio sp.]